MKFKILNRGTVLALKVRHPSCGINVSSFEAIRGEMEKSSEGDENLDYLDETLERRRKFKAVLLDHRS